MTFQYSTCLFTPIQPNEPLRLAEFRKPSEGKLGRGDLCQGVNRVCLNLFTSQLSKSVETVLISTHRSPEAHESILCFKPGPYEYLFLRNMDFRTMVNPYPSIKSCDPFPLDSIHVLLPDSIALLSLYRRIHVI